MCDIETWFNERRYSKIENYPPDQNIFPNFYKTKRFEFTLNPGEMLFIPSGMFHFVISEDVDQETGLCMAINFWYERKTEYDEDDEGISPSFGWHDIHKSKKEIFDTLHNKEFKVHVSKTNCFPPNFMRHRYESTLSETEMTFEKFLKEKNLNHYIAQHKVEEFKKFAIPFKNDLISSCVWMNWGNCNTLPHYDGMHNWLCQILGTRKVILIPQSERDLLYIFNPYPIKLLEELYKNRNVDHQKTSGEGGSHIEVGNFTYELYKNRNVDHQETSGEGGFHIEVGNFTYGFLQEIIETLGEQTEVIVNCKEFEDSYKNEVKIQRDLHNNKIKSHSELKIFKVKKYFAGDSITNNPYIGILWFVTKGEVEINNDIRVLEHSSTISFNSKFPVRILSDCVIVTPYEC